NCALFHACTKPLTDIKKVTKKDCRRGVVNNQLCSWSFHVDGVLHHAPQEEVYNRVARPVVLAALEGYNGTAMMSVSSSELGKCEIMGNHRVSLATLSVTGVWGRVVVALW
uniref:Uncharacterized protein n=1 Tax=Denticeps clupeoides TaxID=299321 RepID=A0AAY4B0Q7_9TELE